MLMAIAFFWFGRHKYKRVPQTDNILWRVAKAVSYALKKKVTTKVRIVLTGMQLIMFSFQDTSDKNIDSSVTRPNYKVVWIFIRILHISGKEVYKFLFYS